MQLIASIFNYFAAPCEPGNGSLFLPTWYKYIDGTQTSLGCDLSVTFPDDIGKIVLAVIEIALRVGGIVAVGFVIYGGFRYITSQGEPDATKSARQTITNAIIGVVITTIATAAVTFIGSSFIK